jgi:uncharacterized membrane protein
MSILFLLIFIFILLAVLFILISLRRSPLHYLLFGISLILVGLSLLKMQWAAPAFFIPYSVVLLGLISAVIGFIKKE